MSTQSNLSFGLVSYKPVERRLLIPHEIKVATLACRACPLIIDYNYKILAMPTQSPSSCERTSIKVPRRCRASQARAVETVNRAINTWREIYSTDCPDFVPSRDTCLGVSKQIKSFLGSCPSSEPELVLPFQSIKKLLPPSCQCMEAPLLESVALKLQSPPLRLPKGYRLFCRKLVSRLFRPGWDKTYYNHCQTVSPPIKATLEAGRKEGGCLAYGGDQDLFLDAVYGNTPFEPPPVLEGSLFVAQSSGKPRPLSLFPQETLLLKPLHKTIYDHITRSTWCCRGDVTDEKLAKAGFYDDGHRHLVSGDYSSATDNLPIEIAECIIDEIRATSSFIPPAVWNYARVALRPVLENIEHGIDPFVVRTGQMMGSLLSFPLLCIQNYCAFRFAAETFGLPKSPVLINGDDILFMAPADFFEHWVTTIRSVGLEVEKTKTSVEKEWGTLNSTLLRFRKGVLSVVPTLRLGQLRPREYANNIGTDFLKFLSGQSDPIRWVAGIHFFRWHIALLRRSGRIYANEWGFRGRLATRISRIFGLWPKDMTKISVPATPCPHNVILRDAVPVDKGSLSEELSVLNSLQMVSWKWSVVYEEQRQSVRYCLELSMAREFSYPDFERPFRSSFGSELTPPSTRWIARQFKESPMLGKDLVFREVLLSQDFSEFDPLPSYAEATMGLGGDYVDGTSGVKEA